MPSSFSKERVFVLNKWREIAIVFLITAILPFAKASILPDNCSQFNDWKFQDCQNILNDTSISLKEKEDLYINLLAGQSKLPAHDFAWNWNKTTTLNSIPENVSPPFVPSEGWKVIMVKNRYHAEGSGKPST